MYIDSDKTKEWWLRFETDDLVDAEELIDFVMYHKVSGSSEYHVSEKDKILSAWVLVKDTLWDMDYD